LISLRAGITSASRGVLTEGFELEDNKEDETGIEEDSDEVVEDDEAKEKKRLLF
jgi:hypothetical protein